MRLIDADKLEDHEQIIPLGNAMYESTFVVYKDDIDQQPTVEAIPISFIEQFEKECEELDEWRLNYEGDCHFDAPVISGLLEKWRKENATES